MRGAQGHIVGISVEVKPLLLVRLRHVCHVQVEERWGENTTLRNRGMEAPLFGLGAIEGREGSTSLDVVTEKFYVQWWHVGEVYHFLYEPSVVDDIERTAHIYSHYYCAFRWSLFVEAAGYFVGNRLQSCGDGMQGLVNVLKSFLG